LIIAIQSFNGGSVFVPVLRPARTEDGRGGGRGGRSSRSRSGSGEAGGRRDGTFHHERLLETRLSHIVWIWRSLTRSADGSRRIGDGKWGAASKKKGRREMEGRRCTSGNRRENLM